MNVRDEVRVWTETFERDRSTLPDLQPELGRAIATQIGLQLSPTQQQALLRRLPDNPRAYEHYVVGRNLRAKASKVPLLAAITEFKKAIDLDPEYALAYAGLADSYSILPVTSDVPSSDAADLALEAATRAVSLDGQLAEAHAALGWQEFWLGWNWPKAEASLRQATKLDPNYAYAHRGLGHVLSNWGGRHSEALAEMERARALDPFSSLMYMVSAQAASNSRDFDVAERHARQSVVLDQKFWAGHLQLAQALAGLRRFDEALAEAEASYLLAPNAKGLWRAYVLGRMGRRAEALKILQDFEQKTPSVPPYEIAAAKAGLNDGNGVFAALEKAHAVRDVNLVFLPVDSRMDSVRDDPRFKVLLDRCGFTRQR
jgi:tetratricopeptide (TPR) repeat protein